MFVTQPSFEGFLPAGLGAPHDRYWLLALLSTDSPWFLLGYRVERRDGPVVNNVLVGLDRALHELIAEVEPSNVVSLYCISPANTFNGEWLMRSVSAVWTSSSHERSHVGPLVFGFHGQQGLFDAFLAPVAAADGRQRLLELLPTSSSRHPMN